MPYTARITRAGSPSSAGDDVGLVAVSAKAFQHLLHRQVGEFGVGPFPALVFGCFEPLLHLRVELIHRHAGEGGRKDLLDVLQIELSRRHRVCPDLPAGIHETVECTQGFEDEHV